MRECKYFADISLSGLEENGSADFIIVLQLQYGIYFPPLIISKSKINRHSGDRPIRCILLIMCFHQQNLKLSFKIRQISPIIELTCWVIHTDEIIFCYSCSILSPSPPISLQSSSQVKTADLLKNIEKFTKTLPKYFQANQTITNSKRIYRIFHIFFSKVSQHLNNSFRRRCVGYIHHFELSVKATKTGYKYNK